MVVPLGGDGNKKASRRCGEGAFCGRIVQIARLQIGYGQDQAKGNRNR